MKMIWQKYKISAPILLRNGGRDGAYGKPLLPRPRLVLLIARILLTAFTGLSIYYAFDFGSAVRSSWWSQE